MPRQLHDVRRPAVQGLLRRLAASLVPFLSGLLFATVAANALAGAPRSLRFEHLGLEQGLSQESVLTILQDRDGFMWFGSQDGLNRFDGYRIRVYRNDPNDPRSLVDNYVLSSYEDAAGRKWFGTRGGLVRFDDATQAFVRYPFEAGRERVARNRAVSAIVGDGAGGLWIGTGEGLIRLDPSSGRFRTWRHDPGDPASLRDDRVAALAMDGRGGLWIGSGVGIDHLPAGAAGFDHYDVETRGGSKRNTVVSLSMGPRDTLWIGTGAGLDAWRIGDGPPQRRHVGFDEGMSEARINTLYHDRGSNLWVGTDLDGLKWRDPVTEHFVTYASQPLDRHTLSDNQVSAVWVDRTGTLWAGTRWGGVNRTDLASGGFGRFSILSGSQPNASRKVRAIAAGADGKLWLGTTGSGLIHLEPISGRTRQYLHDPDRPGSLPDDLVSAVLPGRGRLWVGSPTGLSWRDPETGRFTPVALGRDSAGNYVQDLMLDRAGNLWVVTRGGLFLLAPDGRMLSAWRHDPLDPASLGENYGFCVIEDSAGAIWIGTENGLDRLDRGSGTFTHFRHDDKDPATLRHNRVYYLYQSAHGDLWVGTAAGLHRMERVGETGAGGALFRYFPVTPGHEPVPIGGILEDKAGQLWISTTVGLSRLDPASGNYKSYNAKDGLIDGTYFVGAAARGIDGDLHFGGVNGMTSFMPDAIHDNPFPAVPVITDFLVRNRSRLPDAVAQAVRRIELPYRDSAFTLEFSALHFADPGSNRFAYRLVGFDRDWTTTDAGKRFASYTNLDPRTYVFEVRAANKDGLWSEAPARLEIAIAAPFWMTWWFRLLATLLLLGAGWAIYRLRIRVLLQQTERLERQVRARTAELVLQKEAAEQQKEAALQARRNIALLSDIGRELTAKLDGEAIMACVYGQVRQLMDVHVFALGLLGPGQDGLEYPYVMEDGRRIAHARGSGEWVLRLGRRCVERCEEILIDDFEQDVRVGDMRPGDMPGEPSGAAPRSVMFVPIMVGARALGVLSVQSRARGAYQHVQLDMLSTLAAYAGVALDNADAYRQLKETQAQLAAREKLASLGSLVAGVAHELNTPIGNSLLMASTLHEKTETLAERFASASLKKSELEAWIAAAREASSLIERSLHSAADLVNSFKQVSVDQASTQRRRFDLLQSCQEIAATLNNQVRRAGHVLELEVAPGIVLDSYPGPFGQVVINFVNNALLHAFDGPGGRMLLSAGMEGGDKVRIVFSDDGRGIPSEHLSRIFDPFFTTRMGQGGTGLGLNIAYTIVTTLLCGTIRVESEPGQGTRFVLELPLRAASAPAGPQALRTGEQA